MTYLKIHLFTLFLSLSLSISNDQTHIETEIIRDLIDAEFGSVTDESTIYDIDQKDHCIIILSETFTQTIDTSMDSMGKFQKRGLTGLDSSTMNDFIKKNQSSVKITEFFLDQIKTIFMDKKKWDEIIKEGGWARYHSLYGYIPTISLSRPGINEKMNKAFIYYGAISDKLGGAGFYVLLEKVNNKWIIKDKIIAWRS